MNNEELLQIIEHAAKKKLTYLDLSEGGKSQNLWKRFKGMFGFGSKLTALPGEIGNLSNLTELNLSDNQLKALPGEIGNLSNLRWIYLSNNKLTALPGEIGNLSNLRWLYLEQNPLTSPPPEIVAQGTKAILAYLRELSRDSEKQWVSKLLVVGEGGVGKTSLLKALRGEPFNAEESTTHGIEIQALNVDHPTERGVFMQLNAWDFGGQEIRPLAELG